MATPNSESESDEDDVVPDMTEAQANTKIAEDPKEFFAIRNLDEGEAYFANLTPR